MPRDLPDLLGDALPRDAGAPDLEAIESRVGRRRAGRLGGAVLALAAAVAIGAQVLPLSPPAPMIDQVEDTAPAGTTVLPLPPAGEVTAAHANGRPVFVVHDDDGGVRVLDAISPHPGDGMQGLKVLAYCTRSGWFEDLWHGSKFAGNGAWVGGPAPYGLAEHTVVATTVETVTVGAMAAAPAREGLRGEEPMGETCIGGIGDNEAPGALVVHDPTAEGAVPGLLYPEVQDGEVVLPDEPQLPLPGDDVTLPLPAPGEVNADHVNGRPVFVRNTGDGNVLVLDAVNPHVTEFGPKVLAWCRRGPQPPNVGELPAGGVPVDLWYSSQFAAHGFAFGTGAGGVGPGGWTGGPAPTGLGQLPVRTVTPGTVTVAGSPLPAPPRVGNDSIGAEGCSEAVSLFPDWPAADPTILDDLVLHEPLFPDDWWYPTPARILGDEPGLPPDELERYLEEVGIDRDELGDLDLTELPALGDVGLAVQREDGVELLALDGTSHGLLRGTSLAQDPRDGHGGPFLLETSGGRQLWVDPGTGATLPADGVTPLRGNEALVEVDGDRHESLIAYGAPEDGPTIVDGPLRVGNGHRHVSGPDCVGRPGPGCDAGSTSIDTDMGGSNDGGPAGCNPTDGFADFNSVSVCALGDDSWVRLDAVPPTGTVRFDVPRYPDQPDGTPTIGRFRDAVFGGPRLVVELALECEVPAVIGFDGDGEPVDPWGGETWDAGPTSTLLGTAVLPDGGGPAPLVQVATHECGDTGDVTEGVWAITAGDPVHLNDVTDPVALWTSGVDLASIDLQLADRTVAATACSGEAEVLVADLDLDGDGRTDTVRLHELADDHVRWLVACLANGRSAVREVSAQVAEAFAVQLGDEYGIAIGGSAGTTHDAHTLLRVFGDHFVTVGPQTVGPQDGTSDALELRSGELHDADDDSWVQWGCRTSAGPGDRPRVELLSIEARQTDDGTEATIASYEVAGATTQLLEVSTEAVDGAPDTAAAELLAQLGATAQCRSPNGFSR